MRKLVALAVLVALAAVLAVADLAVRHTVERHLARHIESAVPGTAAKVHISSWPFTGRLAASGTVTGLQAQVTGVKVGPFPVDSVDLSVRDLKVSRSDLLHGRVVLRSIRLATATATISQQSVDRGLGLPVTLGDGTVGLAGIQVRARVLASAGRLTISVPPLPTITLPLLPAALLPCAAGAAVTPGRITVSCTTTAIPPALLAAATGG